MNDRLYRSSTDRVFSGLCGGMAEHFDLDPSLVRLAWVVLGILTGIFPLLIVYIVMAMVVPEEPPAGAPGWPGWGPMWGPGGQGTPGTPDSGTAPGSGTGPGGEPSGAPADTTGAGGQGGAAGDASGAGPGTWGNWGPPPPPPPPGADWHTQRAYWRAQRRAQRAYWRSQRWGGDASMAGLVFGVILVVVGGIFLLQQAVPSFDVSLVWPAALIVIGAALLAGAFRR